MAYIANLNDLELDQYSHSDLVELTRRIVQAVGATGSWEIIDAATDGLKDQAGSSTVVIAVRNDPDNPMQLERILYYALPGNLDTLQKTTIPLLAACSVAIGTIGPKAATPLGIGPMGFLEMLESECQRQSGGGPSGPSFKIIKT